MYICKSKNQLLNLVIEFLGWKITGKFLFYKNLCSIRTGIAYKVNF